ncbi:hypothetical protein SAMN05444166_4177 [Singulisphaera sp. GP187]|uniref:hypothetical protein n=1 Tax=Singulisphaera sp. GP187 TaxID=1882752 RepID=UPI000929C8DB|nr:hypothetical protein [Singulisphaera sp. GP187]SIO37247.1 hypothetical protein SAMN05444166_4177 [Singulisphaera sp. GP187]
MKRVVPSTPGELAICLHRQVGNIHLPKRFAKFVSIREAINAAISEWDTQDNPVINVCINFKIKGARQSQ